jgi:Fur family transcriptional regulator, peroxide stress response regulator
MDPSKLRAQLSRFKAACREVGLKLTHQRLEIYRELADSTDHPSAEVLHKRLTQKMPTLSLDTVYRTLATFNVRGLIHKVETVESQGRFEVIDGRHHHLICSQCREIIDFHWPSIDQVEIPKKVGSWGKIGSRNVIVYGVCKKCLKQIGIYNRTRPLIIMRKT